MALPAESGVALHAILGIGHKVEADATSEGFLAVLVALLFFFGPRSVFLVNLGETI